jgi:putative tryptophan/tyrosine transport system substrate-binding protein
MRRREFIAGLGSAAAWPLAVRAQQPTMPVVGLLNLGRYEAELRRGLAEAGFVEGKTVAIEDRWKNNQYQQLEELAAELVQRRVTVIVAIEGPAIRAAQATTSTIPIIFVLGGDPIKFGLVASLSRPGGNTTGVTSLQNELTGKRLDLLLEITQLATTVAYMTDPRVQNSEQETRDILEAARALGRQAMILEARSELDIDVAFATLVERGADALLVGPYVLFVNNPKKIVDLAARHKIPAIYPSPRFVVLGGLMSYTTDLVAAVRQIGSFYVAQILRGTKPADLPVQQSTKFELAINLKTATTLGLKVPATLLALADELIE